MPVMVLFTVLHVAAERSLAASVCGDSVCFAMCVGQRRDPAGRLRGDVSERLHRSTKPRITWLILMSAAVGYFFGLHGVAFNQINWWTMFHTLLREPA